MLGDRRGTRSSASRSSALPSPGLTRIRLRRYAAVDEHDRSDGRHRAIASPTRALVTAGTRRDSVVNDRNRSSHSTSVMADSSTARNRSNPAATIASASSNSAAAALGGVSSAGSQSSVVVLMTSTISTTTDNTGAFLGPRKNVVQNDVR